ncbi:MAG: hypothetical protein ACI9JN_000861 [Bacteroidia bacterium]|jgi:hypothetical protein
MIKLVLTTTLFTWSLFAFSQSPTLGVQAGAFSNQLNDGYETSNGFGYSLGLSGTFALSKKIFFRPELNFQRRNLTDTYEESGSNSAYSYESSFTVTTGISMIDIPLLFEYRTASGLGFYIGPQFGTSIGIKSKVEYYSKEVDLETNEVYEESEEYSDDYNDNIQEISMAVGAVYNMNNGFTFDIRAQRSLLTDFDNEFDPEISWTLLQLSLRYTFKTKKG